MEALRAYSLEIALGATALSLLLLVMLSLTNSRLNRTSRLVRQLLTGPEGEDLEQLLRQNLRSVQEVEARHGDLERQLSNLAVQLRGCVQKVGLVRFDAFGDVSGGQSFSIALLDDLQNGVIVTGLFGRSDSRCFGKSVRNGTPEQPLSEEETQALEIALHGTSSFEPVEKPNRRSRARA
jgi:hypothetical protein